MNFVSASQAFESELSVRVAALLQQRVTLTVENTRLKQQMARLRQQKLFMEGQHLRISFHWHAFRESPSMHIYIYNWRLSRASFCFDAWLSRYVTIAWSCTCTSLVDLDLSNFMPLFSPNRYICVWIRVLGVLFYRAISILEERSWEAKSRFIWFPSRCMKAYS